MLDRRSPGVHIEFLRSLFSPLDRQYRVRCDAIEQPFDERGDLLQALREKRLPARHFGKLVDPILVDLTEIVILPRKVKKE